MNSPGGVLVCGSFSYDTIMRFDDRFANHLRPGGAEGPRVDVAFNVSQLRQEFGGCAANICYNLSLLGCRALPVATVGSDFEAYRSRLAAQGIDSRRIRTFEDSLTARDHITTDLDNNQIASFHAGAMDRAHENPVGDLTNIALGVISPDGLEGVRLHAQEFARAGLPFLFDPGQVTPLFSGDELRGLVERARWAIFNAGEWNVFREKTGWDHRDVSKLIAAHVVTVGASGSMIYLRDEVLAIPAARVARDGDPTGCGDAYRAGLVFGLLHGLDWSIVGRLGSTVGGLSYASPGSQNHLFTPGECYARYRHDFGESQALKAALSTVGDDARVQR